MERALVVVWSHLKPQQTRHVVLHHQNGIRSRETSMLLFKQRAVGQEHHQSLLELCLDKCQLSECTKLALQLHVCGVRCTPC